MTIASIVDDINEWVSKYYSAVKFGGYIDEQYEVNGSGFYRWDGLRYFLYEYEAYLRSRGKQSIEKIDWKSLTSTKKDHVTIEHIYPQTETDDWADIFSEFDTEQKKFLTHSLGNLLPLSRSKNSSLQNDSFSLKKNNGKGVGYYNGSASENEIAQLVKWDAQRILSRGVDLLRFMEERWDIEIGNDDFKKVILALNFIENNKEEVVA